MKKFLFLLILIPFFGISQKNVISTNRVFAKVDKVLEFEKARRLVTGFSNDPAKWQSYPNWIGNGSPLNPPGSNSFTKNLPGACRWVTNPNGTSMYKMERTEIHSDSTFTLSCSDAGEFFNLNCDRSWSIDNLKIYTIN